MPMPKLGRGKLSPKWTGVAEGFFVGGDWRNEHVRPLDVFVIETAMRRGKLLSLRWPDVHLADGIVQLHDTKNGEGRDAPLSKRTGARPNATPSSIRSSVTTIRPLLARRALCSMSSLFGGCAPTWTLRWKSSRWVVGALLYIEIAIWLAMRRKTRW